MKRYLSILAAISMVPVMSLAQNTEAELDSDLEQLYSTTTGQAQVSGAGEAPVGAGISSNAPVNGGQPIYILNQATPTSTAQVQQNQVQKQPTTLIEASPMSESRADQIRRARQDAELSTEQRIVEKLEYSRMEDEKRRAQVLFGDKFNNMNQNNTIQAENVNVQAQQAVAQPVYVQPVQAAPQENTRDIVREEIRAAMTTEDDTVPAPLEQRFFSGIVGIGEYPDARNVKGNYALGASFGTQYDSLIVEGTFMYSKYTVESGTSSTYSVANGYNYNGYYSPYNNSGVYLVPSEIDVNQYSGSLAVKYQLFTGMVKPVLGGLAQYSYRKYNWSNDNRYNSNVYYNSSSNNADSHAVDLGVVTGVDLEFTPRFTLGFDFRYLWNMSSQVNDNSNPWFKAPGTTQLEKLEYYVMSLVGRVTF